MTPRVYFFGCWNCAGHYLHAPDGRSVNHYIANYVLCCVGPEKLHLDATLAPRRREDGSVCWEGQGATSKERWRIHRASAEAPQGVFLRHELGNCFSALQWWDRCQGDTRSGCNSTILLEGQRSTEELLAALREHFPHVVANLERNGVALVEEQERRPK